MEKVQVISVKPITSESEECLRSPELDSVASDTRNVVNGKAYQTRSASLPSSNLLSVAGNNQYVGLRKDKCNSSFKNAFSRVSIKNQIGLNQSDKNSNQNQKSGTTTNCFGRSDYRASYNEKIKSGSSNLQKVTASRKERRLEKDSESDFVYLTANSVIGSGLYRSNSSLELDHESLETTSAGNQYFKREYGSHGSINISSVNQETIQSVLHNYQKDTKGSSSIESTSPKARSKISRLWEKDRSSLLKKLLPNKGFDIKEDKFESVSDIGSNLEGTIIGNINAKSTLDIMESDCKEDIALLKPIRRPAIAHYDCHSLAAQMTPGRLRALLADRSNTTTGASAAAMADSGSVQSSAIHSSSEEISSADQESKIGRSNHLVSCCPFFQNEIGGEGERIVSLSREVVRPSRQCGSSPVSSQLHRSASASSVGLLEPLAGSSYWCQTLCPYVKKTPPVEAVDQGSQYYTSYFRSQEHQNWFGVEDSHGPVAISIKKEKIEDSGVDTSHSIPNYQFRFIFRTADLFTCQGTIREESLSQRSDKGKGHVTREAIEYICPNLNLSCLRAGNTNTETEEALIKIDELGIHKKFKVGVMYCRAGQQTEEDMYNNEDSGPAFSEFLEILGQRVRLKDFDKHRGGLDKNTDSTGHYSVYTQFQGSEIMFHVSTLLPYTPNNRKQILRKRHIGNDIVTIIFQEPGSLPFSPKHIRSHFQHVFIIVQAINPCTDSTQYSIAVSRFQDVPIFGPPIPENATFPKSKKFINFLLAKVINGEIAALRSEKFVSMAVKTKHEYLKDLALNHSTSTTLDTSSKFSLIGFSRASKKEKNRFKFVADSTVKGALSWNMALYDATLQKDVDCILGISVESLVVLEDSSSSVVFSASCKSILGWTLKHRQGLHIFYHQGECLIINLCQGVSGLLADEILNDIVARLGAVTQGAESQELVLKRNSAGLLGFNVQQDGIITEVEPYGLAAQTKLLQGSRLVEICTIALSTLSQEQMVDLLKTSMTVTVTVIPPHVDGTARRGCNVPTCNFLLGCSEGDYENLTPPELHSMAHPKNRLKHLNRCDRSLSPPRSGSSSGYGTGSSSHSFSMDHHHKIQAPIHESTYGSTSQDLSGAKDKVSYHSSSGDSGTLKFSDYTGTLSSNSSGHSNDRWSEVAMDDQTSNKITLSQFNPNSLINSQRYSPYSQSNRDYSPPPPPLPVRVYQHKEMCGSQGSQRITTPVDYIIEGKKSPYNRHIHQALGNNPSSVSYEQSNYAIPTAIPRPVSKDLIPEKTGTSKDAANSWYDYDNTRFSYKADGGSSKQNEFRRNSSPLALESREDGEEVRRKESLYRARHSIPKSSEDKVVGKEVMSSAKSEDELSGSSSSSPHGFQKVKGSRGSTSSPSISSRNQSPHNITSLPNTQKTDMGPPPPPSAVRLKQGVHNVKNLQHRNSASLASSNLQEELLKLINPDYLSDSETMGAEIREKKKKSSKKIHPFPTHDIDVPSISQTQRPSVDSQTNQTPSAPSSLCSNTGIYDCLPTYQTIGEAEFSHRKSVFANTEQSSYSQDCIKENTIAEVVDNISKKPHSSDGFVLTARPATVISNASTASSPAYLDLRDKPGHHDNVNGNDPRRDKASVSAPPLGFSSTESEMDNSNVTSKATSPVGSVIEDEWSSLVNTATLAIEKGNNHGNDSQAPYKNVNNRNQEKNNWQSNSSLILTSEFMKSVPEEFHKYMPAYFEKFLADSQMAENRSQSSRSGSTPDYMEINDTNGNKRISPNPPPPPNTTASLPPTTDEATRSLVAQLERALASEQALSGKLKQEVNYLRNENTKLLKDSRSAAQQLHQFTEWFFKNVHKS